jgi:hypothetical protein
MGVIGSIHGANILFIEQVENFSKTKVRRGINTRKPFLDSYQQVIQSLGL